jgi:hypothetical protein
MELELLCIDVIGGAFEGVLHACRKLRKLRFYDCEIFTAPHGVSSPSMRELHLDDCDLEEETLEQLLRAFPGLTTIDIFECDDAQELEDLPLGELCPLLRCIKIFDNESDLDETALRSIGAHCPELRRLLISGQETVTDAGLCAVADGCRKLEQLDIAFCNEVTDKTLLMLAEKCADLRSLVLQGCTKVMDKGVQAVMKGCTKLVDLSVSSCTRVSKELKRVVEERYTFHDDFYNPWD